MMNSIQVFLTSLMLTQVYGQTGGSTYVIALLGLDYINPETNGSSDITYELTVSGGTDGDSITVTGVSGLLDTMSVENGLASTTLDHYLALNGSEYAEKALVVASTNGPFTLHVFSKRFDISEGLLAIPLEHLLGPREIQKVYEYIVSTFCETGGICQFAIAAAENDTIISVVLPPGAETIVFCRGIGHFRSNTDTRIGLEAFEAAQFESRTDLSGTHIYSFKPIVVMAGSRNVTINDVIRHSMEQLVPSSHWGTSYVAQSLYESGYGDIIKVSSNWPNTEVEITGFPPAIIPDKHSIIVRRIAAGQIKHIRANKPIQVVQITGVNYGSSTTQHAFGMTVVPSVEQWAKSYTLSCYDGTLGAKLHIGSYIATGSTVIEPTETSTTSELPYTGYKVDVFSPSAMIYKVTTTDDKGTGGIAKCGISEVNGVMPLGVLHQNRTHDDISPPTAQTGGLCKESLTVTTSPANPEHTVALEDFTVLKLRVKTCSQTLVRFHESSSTTQKTINVQLSAQGVVVTSCGPTSCDETKHVQQTFTNPTTCGSLSFFWFRIIADSKTLCVGAGPFPHVTDTTCGTGTEIIYTGIAEQLTVVSMKGLRSPAYFNYDLERDLPCEGYESAWRCENAAMDCSSYGTDFCTDPNYQNYAQFKCRKHCGLCSPDSVGRQFKFIVPSTMSSTTAYVTFVSRTGLAGVASGTSTVAGTLEGDVMSFQLPAAVSTAAGAADSVYVVVSDTDVMLMVYYDDGTNVRSFAVNPVDSFETEYVLNSYCQAATTSIPACHAVSDRHTVSWLYYSRNGERLGIDSPGILLTGKEILPNTVLAIGSSTKLDRTAVLIRSNYPFTIFCSHQCSASAHLTYNQLIPTVYWDTSYKIPSLNPEQLTKPYDGKLIIQTYTENTIITISDSFDSRLVNYDRGGVEEQEITTYGSYTITSRRPINVGMCLYDPGDPDICKSFHFVPGSSGSNLPARTMVSVPDKILKENNLIRTSLTTYFSDGTFKNAETSNKNFYVKTYQPFSLGISIVIGENNKWMTVPGPLVFPVRKGTGSTTCTITAGTTGDGIDNDCDGISDEEECCFLCDSDLDGRFSEDCGILLNDSSFLPAIEEPTCTPIIGSINNTKHCWAKCGCKCSWVKEYKDWLNKTKKEKDDYKDQMAAKFKFLAVDSTTLTSATAEKESANDDRPSSASIGYVGIALFTLTFASLVLMDISALFRDLKIFWFNLKCGIERLRDWWGER